MKHLLLSFLLCESLCGQAAPTFTTTFDEAGCLTSLKSGTRELIAQRIPFVRFAQTDQAGTQTKQVGTPTGSVCLYHVSPENPNLHTWRSAGEHPASVTLQAEAFAGGVTFRIVDITPADMPSITLGCIKPVCTLYKGTFANILSDEESFVAVRGYEADGVLSIAHDCTSVTFTREHGILGKRFGVAAGSRAEATSALRAMTHAAGIKHSTCGGAWSLFAEENRSSYLFQYLKSKNTPELIDLAQRIGTTTINLYKWWDKLGHYNVNPNYYKDYPDFTNTIARLKAAGLKVSLHTLTGCINPADPWISPIPSDELVVDASYTLAEPLSSNATELAVNECPKNCHDLVFTYHCNGNVLKVGKELIQYTGIRREKPYAFTGLTRGAFKTQASAHHTQARCDYLHQRYIAFYPDPDKALSDKLTAAIAHTFNDVQADQIYFDGSEGMGKQYAVDAMRRKIFTALDSSRHPILAEASCLGANNWWFHARLGAWDSCYWAAKRFHDLHINRILKQARKAEFLEAQVGWWYPKCWDARSRAHFLDEEEYFASRNAGNDLAMSIQGLDFVNGPIRSGQLTLVTLIGWYERMRLARAFRPEVLSRMAQERAEFRLRQENDGVWRIRDSFIRPHRIVSCSDMGKICWEEDFTKTKIDLAQADLALRIEALVGCTDYACDQAPTALDVSDSASLVQTTAKTVTLDVQRVHDAEHGNVLALCAGNKGTTARGAWASVKKVYPFPYHDFGGGAKRAAFGMWVKGDGSGALFNLQIETPREYNGSSLSEHYMRIDFTGWRYVTFLLRERDAASYPDFIWPYANRLYPWIGRNGTDMHHISGVSIWLNEVPAGAKSVICVSDVRVLEERDCTIKTPEITLNGEGVRVPFTMRSNDYAELEQGIWTHYDRNGEILEQAPAKKLRLQSHVVNCAYTPSAPSDRVEITLAALGARENALVTPLTDAMKRVMRYEYEIPVVYSPKKGLSGTGKIAIRPGECARIVAKTTRNAKSAKLILEQGTKQIEIVLPGETQPLTGTWTYHVQGQDPSSDFRLELSKAYVSERPCTAYPVNFDRPEIIPQPVHLTYQADIAVRLDAHCVWSVTCPDSMAATWVKDHAARWFGVCPKVEFHQKCIAQEMNAEGYTLSAKPGHVTLTANSLAGIRYAVQTLRQAAQCIPEGQTVSGYWLPACEIQDAPKLAFRGLHICWFPETRVALIERMIRYAAYCKMNAVVLETWGTFQSEQYPFWGWKKKPMTKAEVKRLVALAQDLGVCLIPQFNTFGHASLSRISSSKQATTDIAPQYQPLFEPDGWNWCLSNPSAKKMIHNLIIELHEAFGNPPYFHIGCDEAHAPGCARCRAVEPYAKLVEQHITEISTLLKNRGAQAMMWHDMLLAREDKKKWAPFYAYGSRDEAEMVTRLPRNIIICDWYYGSNCDRKNKPLDYKTLTYFSSLGFPTLTCPWNVPAGTAAQGSYAVKHNLMGLLGTTWHHFHNNRIVAEIIVPAACAAWGSKASTKGYVRHWRQMGWDTGIKEYEDCGTVVDQVPRYPRVGN